MTSEPIVIKYDAAPTVAKFHKSEAFVRGIRGPIGSGKSVGCCLEIFMRMSAQAPGKDGVRRSRWAIIRNTYPELETTTIKTWLDWFPEGEENFGKMNRRVPICHHFKYNDIEAEVYFIAMDRPDHVKKLLSLELTGIWYNEAREVPIEVIMAGIDRVGRYPSQRDRPDSLTSDQWPTWYGVIMDTNSPDDDHWWPVYAGDSPVPEDWEGFELPDNWQFFSQPPAATETKINGKVKWVLNPKAENLQNLPKGYYRNLIQGKPVSHVRVYVGNQYGTPVEGRTVYPEYVDDVHKAEVRLKPIPGKDVYVGLDFGRTPAAVFGQFDSSGQWRDLHEIVTARSSGRAFAKLIKMEIAIEFPGTPLSRFNFYGDPSGGDPQGGEDSSYFDILKGQGIKVMPAPTQDPTMRIEAGREPLERILPGNRPAYKISPTCKFLIKGFKNGYRYPKMGKIGSIRYGDKPDKNKYSHVHEARQYGMCGAGFGKTVTGKGKWKTGRTFKAKTNFKVLS